MIDVDTVTQSNQTTSVTASDRIFYELGKNSYDYKDLLSELIDNSIAASYNNRILNVLIEIGVDNNNNKKYFIIKDDAKGIPQDSLGDAISPAKIQTSGGLNEHGLGMKQAVAALGKLKYLITKTQEEETGRLIKKFGFGTIPVFNCKYEFDSGTEICVVELNSIVDTNATNYTRHIVPYLGARYRRFLRPDNRKMNLKLRIFNTETNSVQNEWLVEEVKPIYFNPSTRTNSPVINNYCLEGAGWRAKFTFGYAPKDENEYEELGLEKPNKFHPYHVSLKNQGFDIIFHDRVILFHQLSELGIIDVKHNDFNTIRGEIILENGFQTAITKNLIIHDENFKDLINRIARILHGEDAGPGSQPRNYLERRSYPEEIPEKLLRDRLANWLKTNPAIGPKSNVSIEYVVEGIEGYIDIFADNEAWELKTGVVSAIEVYQLFMYMDVKDVNKGYIVGKDISNGGKNAIEFIKNKHKKTIEFSKLSDFPINHPPTKDEIAEYY